jgi:hypothetical protein
MQAESHRNAFQEIRSSMDQKSHKVGPKTTSLYRCIPGVRELRHLLKLIACGAAASLCESAGVGRVLAATRLNGPY